MGMLGEAWKKARGSKGWGNKFHDFFDPFDITGGDAAAKQAKAQSDLLAEQKRLAGEVSKRGDQGIQRIGEATSKAGGYLGEANTKANDALSSSFKGQGDSLRGGRNQSLESLASGYGAARTDVGAGFGQGRSDLASGYGQARGDLGQLAGMGSVGAYDAMSQQRDRAGAMLNKGLYSDFQQDPGYQFRLQQGEQAILRNASAHGGRGGGDTMKALADYNQGLASQEFGNFAARRQAEAGIAGGVDAQGNSLLQNQAGRYDQGNLAAQGYRAGGLSQLGSLGAQYGQSQADLSAQGGQALGGLASDYGQQQAGIQTNYGQNMANAYGQYGQQQAGQANLYGTQMAGITTEAANNQANIGIGVGTGNQNSLGSAYKDYADQAGAAEQASSNQKAGILGGALSLFSDARLKDDIQLVSGSRFEALGLHGCRWVWNEIANRMGLVGDSEGVIAQEVLVDYPHAVGERDGFLTIDYAELDRLIAERGAV